MAPQGTRAERFEPPNTGTSHLCLLTDDLPALYEHLVAQGLDTFVSPPVLVDTGINTGGYGLYVHDPDGMPGRALPDRHAQLASARCDARRRRWP